MIYIYNEKKPEVIKVKDLETYCYAMENSKNLARSLFALPDSEDEENETLEKEFSQIIAEQEAEINTYRDRVPFFDTKTLGENISYLTDKYSMKISDLESLLGLSAGYISRTLGDGSKRKLSIDAVWKISQLFEINIDRLVNVNMSEVKDNIKPVLDFIEKLKKETTSFDITWKRLGLLGDKGTEDFYSLNIDEETGEKKYEYNPKTFNGQPVYATLVRDKIYSTSISVGTVYIVPVFDWLNEDGFDVFIEDYNPPYTDSPLVHICGSYDEMSGTLTSELNSLYNTIKEHENDYTISDAAKNLIFSYLKE